VNFSVGVRDTVPSLVPTNRGEPIASSSEVCEPRRRRIKRAIATIATRRGRPRPTPSPAPKATESFLEAGAGEDSGDSADGADGADVGVGVGVGELLAEEESTDDVDGSGVI